MTVKNKKCPVRKCPWGTLLNYELSFLVACCQTNPSEDDIKEIHTYLEHLALNADTPVVKTKEGCLTTILSLATQHGILPLVYKTLKKLQPDSSSTNHEILSAFKQQYLSIAQRNMLMSAELIRIMKLLEDNGIEALAFKGPALAQMAYGDITLRQYVDLDVLVRKEDIYKTDSLLKDHGYQRVLDITSTQEAVYMQYAHDLGLYHPKSGVHFEMHWSLMDDDYPMQIDLNAIWKNPQIIKINQQEIRTFPTEQLLLYLCIHGSKHLWERIEWIKDIDLLIRREDISWEKIIKEADDSGFETMFYLGLLLSMQLFGTPLPENITKHISDDKRLHNLSDHILKNWQTPKNSFHKTATMLKLFPGIKERLIYLHKILIKPSFNEYWYIDFPKGFYWLYYFLRPYLLIKKYFTRKQKV